MIDQKNIVSRTKVAGGMLLQCTHASDSTATEMRFSIFLPPQKQINQPVPANVLYWLSGLTCTDENFCQKAGAFNLAAELGLCIVCPDTSPRGTDLSGEHESYDFGSGAGFYLNATQQPWSQHYKMYDYVTRELPCFIEANFPVSNRRSISGHSMGGHGALTIGIRNAERYQSISAFSPIVNPMDSPWGQKAFTHYLGSDKDTWKQYDACELLTNLGPIKQTLFVDQGTADDFLSEQLKTQTLVNICEDIKQPCKVRMQEDYDHSYYFVSSFIADHLNFHSQALAA